MTILRALTRSGHRLPLHALALAMLLVAQGGQAQIRDTGSPTWNQLSASERQALEPLRSQWPSLDDTRRRKWREIALRYPQLPPEQQRRLQSRMVEWAAMSTAQRNAARLRFEESKQLLSAQERQARWDAYLALPEDQRQLLLSRSTERRVPLAAGATPPLSLPSAASATAMSQVQPKSNIVPAPASAPGARPVAPATVQAAVGASTRPLTQRPVPPRHLEAGQPKIAASPEFTDGRSLAPQRPTVPPTENRRASE